MKIFIGKKKLIKQIEKLEEENASLREWDVNKDSRNSRQRTAYARLARRYSNLKKSSEVPNGNKQEKVE